MQHIGFIEPSGDTLRLLETWELQFDAQIQKFDQTLIDVRRHLHAHPEPSGEERQTSQYVAQRLQSAGLNPHICRHGLGVTADIVLGQPPADAPLIAIRADIDALRMQDEKLVAYASQNPGVTHACGHDAHTSIALGAAMAVAGLLESPHHSSHGFGVKLRFLFQPAEETTVGARWLVEQGVLEGVDAILALHVDPERRAGTIGIRYGTMTASCDEVSLVVNGHGGHGARPHDSVDPIAAASQLINALYQFLPRSVDSRNASVFTIGRISGGYAANVIPERVELLGSLRTTDVRSRQTLKRRIREIADGVEDVSGAQIEISFEKSLGSVDNHPAVTRALEAAARRVVGDENVQLIERPSMGGEDFAVYQEHVPGAMLRLGCAAVGVEPVPFLHSPRFDLDERALSTGARILVRAAVLLSAGRVAKTVGE